LKLALGQSKNQKNIFHCETTWCILSHDSSHSVREWRRMTEKELIEKMFRLSFEIKTETAEMPFINKLSEGEKGIIGWLCHIYPEPIASGDIAVKMKIGTGRVGNALKSLEQKGLIQRKRDEDDQRKVLVSLTKKGYEKGMLVQHKATQFLTELIDDVSIDVFEEFLDDFQTIMESGKKLRKRKEYQNVW
jgi:DNA-binding MarR family transcriptional regulator